MFASLGVCSLLLGIGLVPGVAWAQLSCTSSDRSVHALASTSSNSDEGSQSTMGFELFDESFDVSAIEGTASTSASAS